MADPQRPPRDLSAVHAPTPRGGRDPRARLRRGSSHLAAVAACAWVAAPAAAGIPRESAPADVTVVVRAVPGHVGAVALAVRRLAGTVTLRLPLIDGLVARVPARAVGGLEHARSVASVTPDRPVSFASLVSSTADGASAGGEPASDDPPPPSGEPPPEDQPPDAGATVSAAGPQVWEDADGEGGIALASDGELSSWYLAPKTIKAEKAWDVGITGAGVDVALIDSGVVPVPGLGGGNVVYGPDLSFESQSDELRNLDTYGHGTHMAGIIASTASTPAGPVGIAPGARIVSVKIANAQGLTDVSQVLAAIDWVVQHRNDDGLHIRVLNLSFGTDSSQAYRLDPLAFAVEQAWRKGIVVIVAAGNGGSSAGLNDPAYDPAVIAVGASDSRGTYRLDDDTVADWSSRGGAGRAPDVYVPGTRILSMRDPGSAIDLAHPEGRVGSRFFRGSGTSEAAAIVSGAVALLLQRFPQLTPDRVKELLPRALPPRSSGAEPAQDGEDADGLGSVLDTQLERRLRRGSWTAPALGTGSLDLARGSVRLVDGDSVLAGERDIFGSPWTGDWAAASEADRAWSPDGMWNGSQWIGTWTAPAWSGVPWSTGLSSSRWSSSRWSGEGWQSSRWSASGWSGAAWATDRWSTYSWGE